MKTDTHHALYPRRIYHTANEKLLRRSEGLVLPLNIETHRELHANVECPQKPSKWLTERLIDFTHDDYENNVYDKFYNIIQHLGNIANTNWSDERATEAYDLYANFINQYSYVRQGQVDESM